MRIDKYSEFQLQDFLEDDFFVQWVIHPNANSNLFWELFTRTYPHKKDTLTTAADMVRMYRTQDFTGNEDSKQQVWQRISGSIEQSANSTSGRLVSLSMLMRVAAVLLVIVAGAAFLFINSHTGHSLTIATMAGQIKTIVLPDQSKVTLNGNSSLTYSEDWQGKGPREVWIKGEGFFEVQHLNKDTTHIASSDRFIVHCTDVNIEVLGTTFNVKSRSGKTNVALLTGKISIQNTEAIASTKPLVMAPGDYVEYGGKKLLVAKKLAKPSEVVTWRSDDISFSNATLREITETLQDRFGYSVAVSDSILLQQKIEGDINVTNVADLLDVVTTTLNIKIQQTANKHITISK